MNTTRQQQVEAAVKWIEEAWKAGTLSQTGQAFIGQLEEAFTDRQYEVDDVMVQGEKVIARVVITGKHTGIFAGVPATKKNGTDHAVPRIHGERWADRSSLRMV